MNCLFCSKCNLTRLFAQIHLPQFLLGIITTLCLLCLTLPLTTHAEQQTIGGVTFNTDNCIKPPILAMDYVTVAPRSNSNLLTWATLMEIENAGFNVYRAEKDDTGKYINITQINPQLIPAQVNAKWGATYSFEDNTLLLDKTYYYAIESLDTARGNTLQEEFIVTAKPLKIAPAACLLYGVHGEGIRDSLFFTYNLQDKVTVQLGSTCKGCSIQALDAHPLSNELYAASSKYAFGQPKGHLYRLDPKTAELMSIGNTGFEDVTGLTFDKQGNLWGWAKGNGLIRLDIATGKGSLAVESKLSIEDLTWNVNGDSLYGVVGSDLWRYEPNTQKTTKLCNNLPKQTRAIRVLSESILPKDFIVLGTRVDKNLRVFNTQSCKEIGELAMTTPFEGTEGVALPLAACALTETLIAKNYSLPVILNSFFANFAKGKQKVMVTWQSAIEIGNKGFNLYRAQKDATGNFVDVTLLNTALITSLGSQQVNSYSYEDNPVDGNNAYYYWLETVNNNGETARLKETAQSESPLLGPEEP